MLDPDLDIFYILFEGGREQLFGGGCGNVGKAVRVRAAADKVWKPAFGKIAAKRVGVPINFAVARRGVARRIGDRTDVCANENLDFVLPRHFLYRGDTLWRAACVAAHQFDFSAD